MNCCEVDKNIRCIISFIYYTVILHQLNLEVFVTQVGDTLVADSIVLLLLFVE